MVLFAFKDDEVLRKILKFLPRRNTKRNYFLVLTVYNVKYILSFILFGLVVYYIQSRAILQDYWMSYINEIQYLVKSHFYRIIECHIMKIIRYYKIFFHPLYNTKKFLLPYFQHIPFSPNFNINTHIF